MARNAGWTPRTDPAEKGHPPIHIWGRSGTGRMRLDWEHGWARVYQNGHVIDLHGPGQPYNETVHLISPTPAKLLAAARLLGLDSATTSNTSHGRSRERARHAAITEAAGTRWPRRQSDSTRDIGKTGR